MSGRAGNNPTRRVIDIGKVTDVERQRLTETVSYVGSGHHKKFPSNYGFTPPTSPRPWKSICDGIRIIPKEEAQSLFRDGITKGMFSEYPNGSLPKYVWSVDHSGAVYEAKTDPNNPGEYHGYRLEDVDPMSQHIRKIWQQR